MARAHIGAAKAMAVTSTMPPMPAAGAGAAGLGHALHRECRPLGGAGVPFKRRDLRERRIDQVEVGKLARQQLLVGKTGERVLGRDPRHRDSALGERVRAIALDVIGRDHRLPPADQHAQAHVVAFGALGFLHRAFTHLDRYRDGAHRDRIGRVRARPARGGDEASAS